MVYSNQPQTYQGPELPAAVGLFAGIVFDFSWI